MKESVARIVERESPYGLLIVRAVYGRLDDHIE